MRKFLAAIGSAAIATIVAGNAVAADMPGKVAGGSVAPVYHPWLNVFGGFAVAPGSWFADMGAVWAADRNLDDDGWVFRLRGGFGNYDYKLFSGVKNSVDFQTGEAMIGYHKFWGSSRLSVYGGANIENHQNGGDPAAKVNGTKVGAAAQIEWFQMVGDRSYLVLMATGSTAFDSYFTMAKYGFILAPAWSIGPEVAALGNDRFDARRGGGFVAWSATPSTQVIFSAGYTYDARHDALNDHSGVYGTLHVTARF